MLWYKAWLESRARFIFCLVGLQALIIHMVLAYDNVLIAFELNPATYKYTEYVWRVFTYRIQVGWTFSVLFLGFGGLVREKVLGSADFTLSLPVTRRRLVGVRAALGVSQSLILGLLPFVSVPLLSLVMGKSYPYTQTLLFAFLMTVGGIVYFCLGFFLSTALAGEYAPAAIGVLMLILVNQFSRQFEVLKPFNPQDFLSGLHYLDKSTYFLEGPLPWSGIAVSLACAVTLLLLSVGITERREF